VNGSSRTWQDVADETFDDPAIEIAIRAAGGHRKIADRDKYTTRQIEDCFRAAYEREAGLNGSEP
jgi:hypothetical protein